MGESFCIITTVCGSRAEADQLAEHLVARSLAACVQVVEINSTYRWKGALTQEAEFLLLIKTRADHYGEVEKALIANHPYELPEILQTPIVQGFPPYLAWVEENTQAGDEKG